MEEIIYVFFCVPLAFACIIILEDGGYFDE